MTTLSRDEIIEIATNHLGRPFETAYEEVFGGPPPDELNNELQLTVVAASLDNSSERIVSYLRGFGVPINVVFFSYLEDEDRRYLARSWFATDDDSRGSSGNAKKSKRAPWNGEDWCVQFGAGRPWNDARTYNFVSAGGGKFYSDTIRSLPVGARIWVNVPGSGYVGVARTLGPAVRFEDAMVPLDGEEVPLRDCSLEGRYQHADMHVDENAEWVVPVRWIHAVPESQAFWEKGMFASQHSACKLRQEFTLQRLANNFQVEDDDE